MEWRLSPEEHRWRKGGGAEAMARERRWSAPGAARVKHPAHGMVVVPHRSNLAALQCAAEVWGCDLRGLLGAEVWMAGPGEPVAAMPGDERRTAG